MWAFDISYFSAVDWGVFYFSRGKDIPKANIGQKRNNNSNNGNDGS